MTNANANLILATLVHTTGKTVELLGSMSRNDMKKAFEATGCPLGNTSIADLIAQRKESASGWSLAKPAGATETPAPEVKPETPEGNAGETPIVKTENAPAPEVKPETPADAPKVELTDEQKALAAKVEAEMPTREADAEKKTLRGTDWTKVLPQSPQAVKVGSKLHQLFQYLCTPGGVTKKQIMDHFGWSAGGLSGILHWEPKAKGYFLKSEKRDGALYYSLCYHASHVGGVEPTPVSMEDVATREGNVADTGLAAKIKDLKKAAGIPVHEAAPKAPKADKPAADLTPAAAANASKPPKVTPAQRAQVPASAGNITRRTSAKKAAEQG